MKEEIISMYRAAGYTPEEVIRELAILLGAAILSNNESEFDYTGNTMDVEVLVVEKA